MKFEFLAPHVRNRLTELHGGRDFRGVIAAATAAEIAAALGVEVEQLMVDLLPAAAEYARAPISGFKVGAIARGSATGSLYYGTNAEVPGEALVHTIHAEQSAVINAWMSGEEGISEIAVTASPCGYCRQFLNELTTADTLMIRMPAGTRTLRELLPDAFGPRDLVGGGGLMQREDHALTLSTEDALADAALDAARMSYAPYSGAYAGVALKSTAGRIIAGAYAENAAFNPSLSPMAAALSQWNLAGESAEAIAEAVLVTTHLMHAATAKTLLAVMSTAPLRVLEARNSNPATRS